MHAGSCIRTGGKHWCDQKERMERMECRMTCISRIWLLSKVARERCDTRPNIPAQALTTYQPATIVHVLLLAILMLASDPDNKILKSEE